MFVLYPDYNLSGNRFGGVMISVLASSVDQIGVSDCCLQETQQFVSYIIQREQV
jgi:hypothetical protein